MKVAITAFVEKLDNFVNEANQMTLSGSGLDERFTFVLFVEPEIISKIKKRHNVVIYPYKSKSGYYDTFKYAKSLEFVVSNKHILQKYDYIVKTDTDVFFSDHLNSHVFDEKLYFGRGHYKWNVSKMYELARAFSFSNYESIFEPCSTVLGTGYDVINLMQATDDLCKEVFYYLCPEGDWGNYHHLWTKDLYPGTSTLIAQEIVLTSCYKKEHIVITDKIDAYSTSDKDISTVYHIHSWHTDNVYSKYQALYGAYVNADYKSDSSISSYCLNTYLKNLREHRE